MVQPEEDVLSPRIHVALGTRAKERKQALIGLAQALGLWNPKASGSTPSVSALIKELADRAEQDTTRVVASLRELGIGAGQ